MSVFRKTRECVCVFFFFHSVCNERERARRWNVNGPFWKFRPLEADGVHIYTPGGHYLINIDCWFVRGRAIHYIGLGLNLSLIIFFFGIDEWRVFFLTQELVVACTGAVCSSVKTTVWLSVLVILIDLLLLSEQTKEFSIFFQKFQIVEPSLSSIKKFITQPVPLN